jgi:Zn-dependent peptidase ImmA (M78 family)
MITHDLETKETVKEVDWVSPPSETILRLIYQKEINVHLFRLKIGFSVENFIDFLHDKIDIDAKLASLLSELLGGSQVFWVNRYKQFNEQLEAANKLILSENARFLESLSAIRQTSVDELLDDFRVSTFDHLVMDYLHSPKIMYSKSQRIEPSPVNIANWIRNCELVAEKIVVSQPIGTFNATVLENSLGEVVALTKVNSVNKVINKLKTILLEAGVVLVLSPSETGNGVSGFTKSLLKKYRLVVVTDRYKNNAAFWFTLLHELAHCILHSISQPIVHYSDEEFVLASLPTNNTYEEDEANGYVEQLLFSQDLMSEMKLACRSYRSIMRLGVKYDISAALLVAQIHRDKLAPYSFYRKVYKKVKFDNIF